MTAYDVGVPLSFALGHLFGSLAISLAMQTAAFWLVHQINRPHAWGFGGAISGIGIIAMHYVGTAGVEVGAEAAAIEDRQAQCGIGPGRAAAEVDQPRQPERIEAGELQAVQRQLLHLEVGLEAAVAEQLGAVEFNRWVADGMLCRRYITSDGSIDLTVRVP